MGRSRARTDDRVFGSVEVYERFARAWRDRRGSVVSRAVAEDLAREVHRRGGSGPIADLGCGPGWHTAGLGPGAIAVDAARAMLDLVPEEAPESPRVRADLRALPFGPRVLAGALASKSYVHLPRGEVPLALAELHRCLAVGAPARLVLFEGDEEHAPFPGDDFPGRHFSLWPEALLRAVLVGAGLDIQTFRVVGDGRGARPFEVLVTRARTLSDTVGPGMRLIVCGLNPSLYAADAGVGFARPGNRFWPAARAAGLVRRDRDARRALLDDAVGMTDLVKRATRSVAELHADEYREGIRRLELLASWLQPAAICLVGLEGWRRAVAPGAAAGPQERRLGDRPVYLMPSTSGRNAHSSLDELVEHLRRAVALADAAAEERHRR